MHELYLLFLLLSLLLFSGLKLLSAFRKKQHCPDLNLTDLSAVIPFRNEALTLTKFLASLKIQSVLPAKIIFVNDHSEDDSVQIIEQFINKYGLGTLIHLPQGEEGKKAALNLGITNVETPFVLTLDADIIFNEIILTLFLHFLLLVYIPYLLQCKGKVSCKIYLALNTLFLTLLIFCFHQYDLFQ